MDPTHLIELADQIISAPKGDSLVSLLGEYSDAFALWYAKHEDEIKKLEGVNPEHPVVILQQKHAEVLKVAEELKGEIGAEMRALKKKGKGILAYTDIFPKRMSSIRPRKF